MRYGLQLVVTLALVVSSTAGIAQCANPDGIWDRSRPHVDALTTASGALAQMLKSAPDDNVDKPAAIIVSYEAFAVQDHLVTVLTALSILREVENPRRKARATEHLERAIGSLMERSKIALGSINGYAVQMQRPALTQQVLAVRDQVLALRSAVASTCGIPG